MLLLYHIQKKLQSNCFKHLNEELSKKIIGITISQTNIFASHGVVDQVIPVTWAEKNNTLLDE
jgi:hypothetical protein